MMSNPSLRKSLLAVALMTSTMSSTPAAIMLSIDSYTPQSITFSLSGSFDANSIGDQPGWLAIKRDWQNNYGVHTEWFSSEPTSSVVSLTVGGTPVTSGYLDNTSSHAFSDSFYISNPNGSQTAFLSGTTISGSVTLSSTTDIFIDGITLDLVSGFDNTAEDWVRLESSALASMTPIPEPIRATSVTGAALLLGLALRRFWRTKNPTATKPPA